MIPRSLFSSGRPAKTGEPGQNSWEMRLPRKNCSGRRADPRGADFSRPYYSIPSQDIQVNGFLPPAGGLSPAAPRRRPARFLENSPRSSPQALLYIMYPRPQVKHFTQKKRPVDRATGRSRTMQFGPRGIHYPSMADRMASNTVSASSHITIRTVPSSRVSRRALSATAYWSAR